jgi:putative NIF3 family GTP cyclohydrolase 1 type 2
VLSCGCSGATRPQGESVGAGRMGRLRRPLAARELAELVRRELQCEWVCLYEEAQAPIECIAAVPGVGGDGLAEAAAAGAQAIVTGELKHHELLEARARGLTVILAGHLHSERPVLPKLEEYLCRSFPGLTISIAAEEWPHTIVSARLWRHP